MCWDFDDVFFCFGKVLIVIFCVVCLVLFVMVNDDL